MNTHKNNGTLDLCDDHVKCLFSEFINEKKRSNKISTRVLLERVSFGEKTISRYLGGNGLPKCIPQDTYIQFLQALETSDEEFQHFISEKLGNQGEVQPNCDFEVSKPSESNLSESQPFKVSPRLRRLFVYLPIYLIPLILLTTFLLWNNQTDYYERGVMAKEQKQHSKAIDYFRMAIENDNKNADAYYELADIYADLTDHDIAIENYRKGIAEDTTFSIRAYNNLALLLLSRNDINNTLVLLDRAQQNITTSVEKERWAQSGIILKNQAWTYWKKELYAEAMKLIIQAQELLGPAQILDQYPEVFCLHALIANHTGDPGPAEQQCINRFEAYQAKQQSGAFGYTIKPLQGMTYELYLLVLKQLDNK